MRSVGRLVLGSALSALAALAGCGPQHQLSHLANGDNTLNAIVDYMPASFGLTHDAVVSVQEPHGLASLVATFHNVIDLEVSWLGPEDLNICQHGTVVGYKTAVTLNTSKGLRTVHVRYGC